MRTRTILVTLLAFYAIVSTGFFAFHTLANRSGRFSGGRSSQADIDLPVAPPFQEANPALDTRQDLLARVQIANSLRYTDLQSFVCNERMERYKGRLNGDHPRQIDTVLAQVSFENGVENYSAIQQNERQLEALSSIPGAWSEGEFGTLLRQSRTLLSTQPVSSKSTAEIDGQSAMVYSLQVSGQDSPWSLTVKDQTYRVPFKTEVAVAQANGRILEIKRTSTALPPGSGISEIQWSVVLKPIPIEGKNWLLPITGLYSVLYQQSNHREWNVINFSDYRRYAASSVMHF